MSTRRVLLIDDEADIREVAQLSLEMVGRWDVVTACSGAEGLRVAEEAQPDAILLDFMMPGMDGASTYRGLQANPVTRSIPVIFLTANLFDPTTQRDDLDGVTVIRKPFDPLQLPRQIASTLGWAA